MIKILVDSASDIDLEEAKKLGIEMIPLEVEIDGVTYLDGVNLSHEDFFKKLMKCKNFPKTSQVNEFRFTEKLEEMTKDGDSVIVITISDKLSGTYNQARLAGLNFENVYVVNSNNLCIGERILVEYAIKLIQSGLKVEEIVDKLNEKKKSIRLFALFATIEYLRKGGRLSRVAAIVAYSLKIKPLIDVVGGEVKVVAKAIGSLSGKHQLLKLIEKTRGIDYDMPYVLGHSCFDQKDLDEFINLSKNSWAKGLTNIPRHMVGSTIGTHVGTGAIAIAFFEK